MGHGVLLPLQSYKATDLQVSLDAMGSSQHRCLQARDDDSPKRDEVVLKSAQQKLAAATPFWPEGMCHDTDSRSSITRALQRLKSPTRAQDAGDALQARPMLHRVLR